MKTDRQGLLLIISGPSGVGKTTIAHQVEQALGGVFSVSVTTRSQTRGDRDGVDYHFASDAEFDQMRRDGDLLEWAQVFGNHYGTPRRPVETALDAGKLMILEIDVKGAIQVRKNHPDVFGFFVLPPSEQTLWDRLRTRDRDTEAVMEKRFREAQSEIKAALASQAYDYFIVNDNLEQAVSRAIKLVRMELAYRRGEPAAA